MGNIVSGKSLQLVDAGLLSPTATLEPIATGFTYTEGPVWDPSSESLLFHDIVGNVRYRWHASHGAVVDMTPTDYSNGMTLDREGRLVICQSGTSKVVRRERDGELISLASHFQGKELNSPNDVVLRSNGDIYFTDPAYGRIPVYGIDRAQELSFQGIYRIVEGAAEPELLSDELVQPNGLAFSPDESALYVADSETGELSMFDVGPNGRLSGRRVFFDEAGVPLPFELVVRNELLSGYLDGLKCDEQGNIYQTGRGGVWVISPAGEALGVLELPEDVANLTWGDADFRTLYLACRSTVYRIRMNVGGNRAFGAND